MAAIEAIKREVIHSGRSRQEVLPITAAGVLHYYDLVVEPIHDPSGKIVGIACAAVDITRRKAEEASQLQHGQLFFTRIEQAPMGVYVVDQQFRIQQVNPQSMPAFEHLGPVLGRDFDEILKIQWGAEIGAEIAAIFRHTLETGERFVSRNFAGLRRDLGEQEAYDWEVHRVTLPDGKFGMVCYFRNTTERAQAEHALRASQERARAATTATGVGIWEWNVVTNTVRWAGDVSDGLSRAAHRRGNFSVPAR